MSRAAFLIGCFAASLTAGGCPALAQEPDTSILKDVTFSDDPAQGRQQLRDFGDCLVSTRAKRAVEFLRIPLSKAGSQVQDFVDNSAPCSLGVAMRLYLFHMRGALFESLYLKDFRVPPRSIKPAIYTKSDDPRSFAACLARRDPGSMDAYIRSYPGTAAEQQKMQPLFPMMQACLAGTGEGSAPNISLFRAATAEVLYCAQIDGAECKL